MDPGHTQNHVGVSDRRSNWAHEFQPTTCVRDKSSIGYDFQYVHNQSFFHWPQPQPSHCVWLVSDVAERLTDWHDDTSPSFLRLVQVLFNDESHVKAMQTPCKSHAKAMQSVRPWPGFQNLRHCFHSNRSCFTAWFPKFGTWLRHNRDNCHRKQVFHRSPARPLQSGYCTLHVLLGSKQHETWNFRRVSELGHPQKSSDCPPGTPLRSLPWTALMRTGGEPPWTKTLSRLELLYAWHTVFEQLLFFT